MVMTTWRFAKKKEKKRKTQEQKKKKILLAEKKVTKAKKNTHRERKTKTKPKDERTKEEFGMCLIALGEYLNENALKSGKFVLCILFFCSDAISNFKYFLYIQFA